MRKYQEEFGAPDGKPLSQTPYPWFSSERAVYVVSSISIVALLLTVIFSFI